jgi:acyl-coenzyme A thioesterase PaaI-like protein
MAIVEIVHGRPCYVCGDGTIHSDASAHPNAIGVRFAWHEERQKVLCEATMGPACQGAPGHAHGGSLFAILDEAMGAACWMSGHPVMSAHVSIDYRKPVKLGETLQVAAWIEKIDGRKVHTYGELRNGDVIVTQAKGLFVSSDRHAWDLLPPEAVKPPGP